MLKLNPTNGLYCIEAPVTIYVDDIGADFSGQGTATIPADQLVALRDALTRVIDAQHPILWRNPNSGRCATLQPMRDGSYSVYTADDDVPNYGPLRSKADYFRQITAWKRLGMSPVSKSQEVA